MTKGRLSVILRIEREDIKMKLIPLASNMTELELTDGTRVLFSYQTPVAAQTHEGCFKTDKKWSATTTRHINKWTATTKTKPQEYFDGLVK